MTDRKVFTLGQLGEIYFNLVSFCVSCPLVGRKGDSLPFTNCCTCLIIEVEFTLVQVDLNPSALYSLALSVQRLICLCLPGNCVILLAFIYFIVTARVQKTSRRGKENINLPMVSERSTWVYFHYHLFQFVQPFAMFFLFINHSLFSLIHLYYGKKR